MSDPVTTHDHDDSKDDDALTAATVTPADIGETPLPDEPPMLRRRRTGGLGGLGRTPSQRPTPGQELQPDPAFLERLRRIAESRPTPAPAEEEAPRSRAEVYRAAWTRSLAASGDATDLAGWTIDQLDSGQYPAALRAFADGIGTPGALRNLVLAGPVGTGKSTAAVAVGNAAADRGVLARYVKHSTYLKWLRPEGSPRDVEPWQIRRRFRECDLLVLDDLAAELNPEVKATEFVRDETLNLIGDRIGTPGRATVITTNQPAEAIVTMFGEQLLSRLSKDGERLIVRGPDRRGRLTW